MKELLAIIHEKLNLIWYQLLLYLESFEEKNRMEE